MHTTKILAALTVATSAVALAACADPTTNTTSAGQSATAASSNTAAYDVSQIPTDPTIAALVPEEGTTQPSEFPTIIPALGTKFDVGISSFTITSEREQQVNMVSYLNVGSAWGVATGNPKSFDTSNPCGTTIAVQTGTAQETYAQELSKQCEADGKGKITIMPHELQTDIATKIISGQYDATLADSTVIGSTAAGSNGKIEQLGDVFESAPQGVAIAKDDAELTEAVQQAMQYLMDNGYLEDILAHYGADSAALSIAELNPTVD